MSIVHFTSLFYTNCIY